MDKSIAKEAVFYIRNPSVLETFGYNRMQFVDSEQHKTAMEELKSKITKLKIDFRKFPMYQFFREIGAVEAYAVVQSQMEIANCNLKVVGVFLFEDEAGHARDWMESNKKNSILTYSVQKTKITRFAGF